MELWRESLRSVCTIQRLLMISQTWDYWANRFSPNKNIKVYLGIPASSAAAGGGYVSPTALAPIIQNLAASFPSFGGIMMW